MSSDLEPVEPLPPFAEPAARPWRVYLVALLVTLLAVALVRFRVNLALDAGWWLLPQRFHPYPPDVLLPSAILLVVTLGPIAWLLRPGAGPVTRLRAWCCVGLTVLLTFGLQITLNLGGGLPKWYLETVAATWSELSNGYFVAALKHPHALELIRDYGAIQAADTRKLSTHPPGAVLAYWVLLKIYISCPPLQWLMVYLSDYATGGQAQLAFESTWRLLQSSIGVPVEDHPLFHVRLMPVTLWCALAMSLVGALTVVPTYLLGLVGGDRRTGVLAAVFLALMPNVAFYALALDSLLMSLAAWSLALLLLAIVHPRRRWLSLLSGLALGAMLLTSLGGLVPVALGLAFLGLAVWRGLISSGAALRVAGGVLAGLVVVFGLVALAGLDLWPVMVRSLQEHRSGAGGTGFRHYWPWVWLNVADYLLLVGIPLSFLALEGIVRNDWRSEPQRVLAWSLVTVLLALTLSGTVRGETERLWLCFNPAVAALAAAAAVGRPARFWPAAVQPFQMWLLALTLPPLVRPY